MTDADHIKREVQTRGITRLCHFTQSRKLAHILRELDGIWSTARLEELAPDLLNRMDQSRFDGHINHICCSIEYPNTWYLNMIRDNDPLFKEWVILFLSPALLWREDTLFCPRNSAAHSGKLIEGGYQAFTSLFAPRNVGTKGLTFIRNTTMLPCCPTDDQAEVLVFEHIPCSEIIGIAVLTAEQARIEKARLSLLPNAVQLPWYVAPALFGRSWSDGVRRGERPLERLYED
jgi:hypothetical protein